MKSRILTPLVLALAFAPEAAHAWSHTTQVWVPQEDFPLPYSVAGRADCEETVVDTNDGNYCQEAAVRGFAAWTEIAGCASLSTEYQGESPNTGFFVDYQNFITFNDPGIDGDITTRTDDDIISPGTLAVTRSWPGEQLFAMGGLIYFHNLDADIVFENDVVFTTPEEVEANCNGVDIDGVMTHEIGHLWGMGHSCEEGDPCTDPKLLEATMFWTAPNCSASAGDIADDDIEGINALYGPSASFRCSHQLSDDLAIGVVPFDLKCSIVSDYRDEIVDVEWRWGDGAVGEGIDSSHTYTEYGNYTIEVVVQGDREECGPEGWSNSFRRVGFVRACDVPQPEFSIDHVDGLTYQMLNQTDVSVYGCYTNIEWQVYKGRSATGEPISELTYAGWEPKITFPDEGEYTVVLNLGGPAGTGAAKAVLEAKNHRGEGYSNCDNAGVPTLLGAAVSALLLRRRRSR